MTSLLVFYHASKVATLTQVKAVYSQSYSHMCISISKLVKNISIAIFAGIAVFARLQPLNVITSESAIIIHVSALTKAATNYYICLARCTNQLDTHILSPIFRSRGSTVFIIPLLIPSLLSTSTCECWR